MITNFIFTLGLPGAGKSTYIKKNYKDVLKLSEYIKTRLTSDGVYNIVDEQLSIQKICTSQFLVDKYIQHLLDHRIQKYFNDDEVFVVSADDIKPYLEGYNIDNPQVVHETSVQLAKKLVYLFANSTIANINVLMDGGAINNHYTMDIITYLKNTNSSTKITELFFDTPVEVCIKRIESRNRKVPIENIYEKNLKLIVCLNKYRDIIDNFVKVPYYTNKYVLLDMDGTLASYTNVRFDENDNADFVNGEVFLHLRPVQHVIDFIKNNYSMDNVYICTAVANNIAWEEKNKWLDKYFPEIKKENRLFVGNKDWKFVFVKQFADHQGWKNNEVTLVDDLHSTIKKCRGIGINCIHPSNIEALTDPYSILS